MKKHYEIALTGINGANPLGFLAALGAFRASQKMRAAPTVYLSWHPSGGSWQPVLHTTAATTTETWLETLHTYLKAQANHPALTVANNPKMPQVIFRRYAQVAQQSWLDGSNESWAAFVAAFGSDGVVDEKNQTEDTAFRTMSGAGHQHFLLFMNELTRDTSAAHLKEALLGPWAYRDTQFSMRWDPEDDRRYSLRWQNPSTDPARNVRGANRLAIEALPLFPTMPAGTHLVTTGFIGRRSSDTFWTWPIWEQPISVDICRSLLAHADLARQEPKLSNLSSLGVAAVFRSQRITTGKFRNFTPAVATGI